MRRPHTAIAGLWSGRPGVAAPGLRLSVGLRSRRFVRRPPLPRAHSRRTRAEGRGHDRDPRSAPSGSARLGRGIPQRNLAFPYDHVVPRPPLGPGDPTIQLGEAARRLGITRSTLQGRVKAQNPSIRGLAPGSELNPGHRWLVSLDDVETELRGKGLLATPPPPAEPSVDAMRAQLLQGALTDEKDRRIATLEALVADKDAEISRLRTQLGALGRAVEEQLAAAGRTLAAVTAAAR
jgi:hypothetical protein